MREFEGTHPCNYEQEGGCSVCGLTIEIFEKLKSAIIVAEPEIKLFEQSLFRIK